MKMPDAFIRRYARPGFGYKSGSIIYAVRQALSYNANCCRTALFY